MNRIFIIHEMLFKDIVILIVYDIKTYQEEKPKIFDITSNKGLYDFNVFRMNNKDVFKESIIYSNGKYIPYKSYKSLQTH